jgi:SAM-dependent methyltransferase
MMLKDFLDRLRGRTPRLDASEYQTRVAAEAAWFSDRVNVHDLPAIFHYWSNRYLRPTLETFGFSNPDQFFAHFLARAFAEAKTRPARFMSIGAGNCDTEIRVAQLLISQGIDDFVLECLELNASMLERGVVLARDAGVARQVRPVSGDFNDWKPQGIYDAIMANQSLHHVSNLEGLFSAIHAALPAYGRLVTSDIIGRNGHLRWPEALELVQEFWSELPASYRFNLQLQRDEPEFLDWDCSQESFEGIRAQDILPLLIDRFDFEFFYGFANVIDPFIDRSFGHHFDADSAQDRAFIDRLHERDEAEILAGRITPTHMMASLRRKSLFRAQLAIPVIWKHLTPEFCLRDPSRARAAAANNS